MPRRTGVTGPPTEYLTSRGSWPVGPFRKETPPAVRYAAEIASRLQEAIDASGANMSAVARSLGVARSTLYDVLGGRTFPDIHTIATAERHFGVTLWPTG